MTFLIDPFTENDPSIGPVVNATQHKKILNYIETGVQQGAKLLCGGKNPHSKGIFRIFLEFS